MVLTVWYSVPWCRIHIGWLSATLAVRHTRMLLQCRRAKCIELVAAVANLDPNGDRAELAEVRTQEAAVLVKVHTFYCCAGFMSMY